MSEPIHGRALPDPASPRWRRRGAARNVWCATLLVTLITGSLASAEEGESWSPATAPDDGASTAPDAVSAEDAVNAEDAERAPTETEAPPLHEAGSTLGADIPDLTKALDEAALDLDIHARIVAPEILDDEVLKRGSSTSIRDDSADRWLVAHRVTPVGDAWRVEIITVPPDSTIRRVAVDVVDAQRLEVRAMVLLRDAVQLSSPAPPAPSEAPPSAPTPPPRSTGRAILAMNTALLGGAIGVSLHRAGATEDDRLLYPLAALGVGIGLGASMLIADEWDITTDDAWFLSAGMVWPSAAGMLLATSYDVPSEHRYLYGLSGTAAGVTLATIAVAQGAVGEGDATLAHSGGAFGLGMGALAEGIVRGDLVRTPLSGMGYGTGLGVLAAGVAASQLDFSSSRVLFVDLSALLGGLTGGALATPLLLVDEVDDTRRRLWFGSVAAGTVAGAIIGILATHNESESTAATDQRGSSPSLVTRWAPHAGIIGFSEEGTRRSPAYGAGIQGLW